MADVAFGVPGSNVPSPPSTNRMCSFQCKHVQTNPLFTVTTWEYVCSIYPDVVTYWPADQSHQTDPSPSPNTLPVALANNEDVKFLAGFPAKLGALDFNEKGAKVFKLPDNKKPRAIMNLKAALAQAAGFVAS